MARNEFTLKIHQDDDQMYWGEVQELPGCFASGSDMDELMEAAKEAIELYLEPGTLDVVVSLDDRRARKARKVRPMPKSFVLEG